MSEHLDRLRDMVGSLLAKSRPTPELIRELIEGTRRSPLCSDVTDEQASQLAVEFEAIHDVTMSIGSTLQEEGFEPWLDAMRHDLEFYYWDRYRWLLGQNGFSSNVLATLDEVTDRTLGLLQNPKKEGVWDRRGMVVGHVQSGKTANYTGLVCKAADAGYKVIIIIAGIHNNLRSQTQARIDEGFAGYDSSVLLNNRGGADSFIGVGLRDRSRRPAAFTNTLKDFNKATATSIGIPLKNLNEPAVFVIKKNSSTLKNLLEWLKEHNAHHGTNSITAPMLMIDDEADNASINIKKGKDEVSRINGQIRQILDAFDRSCYVGYTATPFANIFIDPDSDDEMFGADLFPRDFIVSLDPPDNYFGASRVFLNDPELENGSEVVRHIDDNEDVLPIKHKKDWDVVALPASLQTAVRFFVLARAVRLARGQVGKHNSMLVNASRFTDVQGRIRNRIHVLLQEMRSSLRVNGAKPASEALLDPQISMLKEVFDEEFTERVEVTWADVQRQLWESVSPIKAVEVNSKSSGSLDYSEHQKTGLNVIAVGGFSLSRGLTLEGLIVSYFLRNSMMYDTLMQMGRWFGYRPGYDDLCRVWMLEEAEGWYSHIADSIEELREELRQMEVLGATPQQFGLKVRSHPDTLIVTARNKMGSGEQLRVSVGLSNEFIETTTVLCSAMDRNRQVAARLAEKLSQACNAIADGDRIDSGYLVRDVPVDLILEFLRGFQNAKGSYLTETDPITKYISNRSGGELSTWNVLIPTIVRPDHVPLKTSLLGPEITCQRRKEGKRQVAGELRITNNQRVASRGVEKADLEQSVRSEVEENYRRQHGLDEAAKGINYPDKAYRTARETPLLILHLLAIGEKGDDLSGDEPIVAWSISFPKSQLPEQTVDYVVNTTWFRERYNDEDEDEAAGDDE